MFVTLYNRWRGLSRQFAAHRVPLLTGAFFVALMWFGGFSACTDGFDLPDGTTQTDSGQPDDRTTPPDTRTTTPDQTTQNDKKVDPPGDRPSGKDDPVNPPDNPGGTDTPTQPDEPKPPEAFKLISAFSKDGRNVTVRFNNNVDSDATTDLSAYRIIPPLKITGATVDAQFVTLNIDPSETIDSNTVYTVRVENIKDVHGQTLDRSNNNSIIKRTLYLNLVWHQHQPMYLDPLKDEMQGPWVRKHATKDYYDMAAAVEPFKDVHMTINLTPVLLIQLQKYIDRLRPFYNAKTNRIDAKGFLAKWARKTDPWIDLLLTETPEPSKLSKREKGLFYDDPWATVSTSPQIMHFFPEYEVLRDKNRAQYTKQDLLELKFFFEIAWFDPIFLDGPVKMPDGSVVDLTDVMEKRNGKYYLKVKVTEDLCNRMVAENYKIMANTVGIHKKLIYNPKTKQGQIEIITTPFYHPILPLVYDTNLAKKTPFVDDIKLPAGRFNYPADAFAHVAKAKLLYRQMFGFDPRGMWPGEGSVAEDVVDLFVKNGIQWIATGEDNLHRSKPANQQVFYPYKVDSDTVQGTGGDTKDEIVIVFRDNKISDLIGFGIQNLTGEDAANRLLGDILKKAPRFGEPDRLLTIILDGENAWENFTQDHDAVEFFKRFYGKLQRSYQIGEVVSVTPAEYIDGNPKRNVPAHPTTKQKEIEPLNPGSWIDGTFRVWIGEDEESCGWQYLLQARKDLERSGIPRPNPLAPEPPPGSPAYNAYQAWESMYAAQGSDWFWWFGADMTSPANDDSGFDNVFRALLTAVYDFANKAGASIRLPTFRPCVQPKPKPVPTTPCSQCPQINGKFDPDSSEWTADGGFVKDSDSADANKIDANDDVNSLYIAFNTQKLFLGILSNEDLKAKIGSNYQLAVYFSHRHIIDKTTGKVQDDKPINKKTPGGIDLQMKTGGAARRLLLDFQGSSIKAIMQRADGNGGWKDETSNGAVIGQFVGDNKLLELSVPWTDLNLTVKAGALDPLQILVTAVDKNVEVDRVPNFGVFTIFEDASDAVFVTFEVDVSGTQEPINKYGNCCKQQPKPKGPASVFLVGNHRLLGMVGVDAQGQPKWVPNKIQMNQDANNPNIWRLTIGLPKNFKLNYKYTIGTNSDEGRWRGTEEFPVTFRGFLVNDPSGKRCINVKDIFANKPTGGRDGEVGSKSTFTTGCTR